ncbi:MAG: DEAD/DEAH box helicase [Oscillospiraceae bacterium]|nr:DEAD/DEAH box helicase [Oscillospiraceae bacterium]
MLSKSEIRRHCYFKSFYSRGEQLFYNDAVQNISQEIEDNGEGLVFASVRGSKNERYAVSLELSQSAGRLSISRYDCTCPAFLDYPGMCKHCVALALQYRELENFQRQKAQTQRPKKTRTRSTSTHLAAALARYNAPMANQLDSGIQRGTVQLELEINDKHTRYGFGWEVSCQIGVKRMYVVKDLVELVYNVLHGVNHTYGKQLQFIHAPEMFDPDSQRLLQILEWEVRRVYPQVDSFYWGGTSQQYRSLPCSDESIAQILSLYSGGSAPLRGQSVPVKEGDPPVYLRLRPEGDDGARVEIPELVEISTANHGYCLYQDCIYHCSQAFSENVLPFFRLIQAADKSYSRPTSSEFLSQEDYRVFCGNVLPCLEPYVDVQLQNLDLSEYRPQTPEFLFYLSGEGGVRLRPLVRYGGAEYPLFVASNGEYRRPELEEPVQTLVRRYFSPSGSREFQQITDEDAIYDFLKTGLDELRQTGEVYLDNGLRGLRIKPTPTARVGVSLAGGLLDVSMEAEDLPPEEFSRLLHAYSVKKRYYRLRSGEFLSLESGSLAVLSELSQVIGMDEKPHAQVPMFRARYVNDLLTEQNAGIDLQRSTDFKHLIRELRDYSDSDYPVPEALNATLRSYQKNGFRWLCTLSACGLGGILADDMGLGKTIQTIALLLHLRSTALVVCPASLLYNWQAELTRFAPGLRVRLISGTAAGRKQQLTEDADVYVTSYDLLRRDIDLYNERTFGCCILDEAQQIRNPATKAAKAVKRIRAEHRFALTGTPISNRLSDLWSVFDFLMPGYLYSYAQFRERLETPITEGDKAALTRLQRMTAPFILRRKKENVLQELPEKVTTVRYVEMTQEQRLLYRAQEQQLRQQLLETSDEDVNREQIQLLAALTRLRQLCCTPELYLEGYHGGSGKVDACMELLDEARESEHRTLVFSQFTTMLEALYAEAQQRGMKCLYLSGKDTKEKRRDMVEAFQSGDYDVFFLSLKAGGTGLNLTAADYVVHFDPWWNAAAEDQATDRAHRIGQDKTVFVTKLVARESIEERIVAIQEAKREMSDQVISDGASFDGHITREALLELLTEAE